MTDVPDELPSLSPEEVLAEVDLYSEDPARSGGAKWSLREGSAVLGRPLAVRTAGDQLPPELRHRAVDLKRQYHSILFPLDLAGLPDGVAYHSVSVQVALRDPEVLALGLNVADGVVDALVPPLPGTVTVGPTGPVLVVVPRAGEWPGAPASWGRVPVTAEPGHESRVEGLLSGCFRWSFSARNRTSPARGRTGKPCYPVALSALVESPVRTAELLGDITVEVVIRRSYAGLLKRTLAATLLGTPFTVQLRTTPLVSTADDGRGAVRMVVSADVKGYSLLPGPVQPQAQTDLVEVLTRATRATGLREEVHVQSQGDAQVLVFPPGIDEVEVLRRFYAEFRDAMREVNLARRGAERLRLRLAMDHGHAGRAAAGWDGRPAIVATRLRDSKPVRNRLDTTPAADFVLVVSDFLYEDVVRQLAGDPVPDSFEAVDVDEPDKQYSGVGWVHVPR